MFIDNDLINYSKIPASYQSKPAIGAASPEIAPTAPPQDREKESPAYILSLSGKAPADTPAGLKETTPAEGRAVNAAETDEQEKVDGKKPENGNETGESKKSADAEKTANNGEPWRAGKSPEEQRRIEREVQGMKQTETKVIAHEQAHKSAGGQYAGGISYDKSSGPDGKQYIVGGEVSIDMSSEDTPQKTIAKMQTVRRAALAPADPSGQDRAVAAAAAGKEASARQSLAKKLREEASAKSAKAAQGMAKNIQGGGNLSNEPTAAEKTSPTGGQDASKSAPVVFKDAGAHDQEPDLGTWVDLSA